MKRARTNQAVLMRVFAIVATVFWAAPGIYAEDRPRIGVETGEMYPDFLLPDIDGNPGRLSDYRGKKIILFHFASW